MKDFYENSYDDIPTCHMNVITCIKSNSFVKAQREETAFIVLFSIFGLLGMVLGCLIGKKRSEEGEGPGEQKNYVE